MEIISRLSFGMDLVKVQVPMFMLKPISMLEMSADVSYPYDWALLADQEENPEQRFLLVLKQLMASSSKVPTQSFAMLKPYNPVLGETFQCSWKGPSIKTVSTDGSGTTTETPTVTEYISEQTSHHPMVSAMSVRNEKLGWQYTSTVHVAGKYYGNSAEQKIIGEHRIHLSRHNETYSFHIPSLLARGIVWGKGRVENCGELAMTCADTGYSCHIHYTADNFVAGDVEGPKGKIVASLKGTIDGTVMISRDQKNQVFLDQEMLKQRQPKQVKPLSEQDEMSSRVIWREVSQALAAGALKEAERAKTVVEEHQRQMVKSKGEHHRELRFFKKSDRSIDKHHHADIHAYDLQATSTTDVEKQQQKHVTATEVDLQLKQLQQVK
jgi:hypothetical protein